MFNNKRVQRVLCKFLLVLMLAGIFLAPLDTLVTAAGEENLALNKTATSSTPVDTTTYGADKAFDGNDSSRWASKGGTANPWLQVDLGQLVRFDKLAITQFKNEQRILDYSIDISEDGNVWRNAYKGYKHTNSPIIITPVTARYIKLSISSFTKDPTILEFAVYDVNGAEPITPPTATSAPTITPPPNPTPTPLPNPSVIGTPPPKAKYSQDNFLTDAEKGIYTAAIEQNVRNSIVMQVGSSNATVFGSMLSINPSDLEVHPVMENGQILAPADFIAESLGGSVAWDEDAGEMTITISTNTVKLKQNEDTLYLNDQPTKLAVPAKAMNNTLFVPVQGFVQALGKMTYINGNGLIIIGNNENPFSGGDEQSAAELVAKMVTNQLPVITRRPFFPMTAVQVSSSVAEADALLVQFTEEQWKKLAPRQAPRDNSTISNAPDGSDWVWDPMYPDTIKTTKGLVFPDPVKYPVRKVTTKAMSGKTIEVEITSVNGKDCWVQAAIDYQKMNYLERRTETLANAYAITGDEKYARRAIIGLNAWANAVPDYFMSTKNGSTIISADNVMDYYKVDIQRASCHNGEAHELHLNAIKAIDKIYDSQSLKDLSAELGYNVMEHLKNDFIYNILDWLIDYKDMRVHTSTNLSGSIEAIALAGALFGREDYLEFLADYADIVVSDNMKRDYMYPEAPSYHKGYADTNYRVFKMIGQFFDMHLTSSVELEDTKKDIGRKIELMRKAAIAVDPVAFPNGDYPPFDDTTSTSRSPVRSSSTTGLLPAYGHLMLGGGTGINQTTANVHFNDKANHIHNNVLGLTLFGYGQELLGNIRYSRIPGRMYTESTLAMNLVTVDGANQARSTKQESVTANVYHMFTMGNLSMLEPGINGISASEVYTKYPYPGTTSRYQRVNVLNTSDETAPYLIDLFKVSGGSKHDYTLYGSTYFDMEGSASIPLTKINREYPMLAEGETFAAMTSEGDVRNWYGMFREMSTAESKGNFDITFKRSDGNGNEGTRIFVVDNAQSTVQSSVYLGKAPYSYRNGTVNQNIFTYWRPALLLRNEGSNIDSFFATVIEPTNGESQIESVTRLPLSEDSPEHIALSIKFKNGREDVVLVNMNNEAITGKTDADTLFSTANGSYSLEGRVGIVSTSNEKTEGYLITGKTLKYNNRTLSQEVDKYTGVIRASKRIEDKEEGNILITDADLPTDGSMDGKWMLLTFENYKNIPNASGAYDYNVKEQKGMSERYKISHVMKVNGKTYIYMTDDHALRVTEAGATEVLRPQRTFEGKVNFTIEMSSAQKSTPSAPVLQTAGVGDGYVNLTWSPAAGATSYKVYRGTTSGFSVTDAVYDTVSGSVYGYNATGLTNGTTYYFVVKASNANGDSENSNEVSATPKAAAPGGSAVQIPAPAANNEVDVLVNGKPKNVGTATITKKDDRTVTTIVMDPQKLAQILEGEGKNSIVTIPVNTKSDVVVGVLTGDMVKGMENKEAILEIKTETAGYKLPAQQIKIDDISTQFGTNVALKDIKVQVEISKPADGTLKVIEDSANKGNFTILAPPVEFTVTCTYDSKTVLVSSFNTYVERTIALPKGVDPNKITTGIVIEPDGTVRHVPTKLAVIDGKYYAVINSWTNSTYSVVWHPLEFKDAAGHWAKDAVNDMGSRMVISGVGNSMFEPDRDITRAEFAAIIVRALGLKSGTGSTPFTDVRSSEWYAGFIKTAYEYKLISGYSEDKFAPMDKITREQAMTMITRAMRITGLKVEFASGEAEKLLAGFSDADKADDYAKGSIAASVKTGIVSGRGNNLVAPKENITRAEVAEIVRRLLQKSELI